MIDGMADFISRLLTHSRRGPNPAATGSGSGARSHAPSPETGPDARHRVAALDPLSPHDAAIVASAAQTINQLTAQIVAAHKALDAYCYDPTTTADDAVMAILKAVGR